MGALLLGLFEESVMILQNQILSSRVGANILMCNLTLYMVTCSWQALRVQKVHNKEEPITASQEVVPSASSVSVSKTN